MASNTFLIWGRAAQMLLLTAAANNEEPLLIKGTANNEVHEGFTHGSTFYNQRAFDSYRCIG
jgi:hypothetical protein